MKKTSGITMFIKEAKNATTHSSDNWEAPNAKE